MVCRLLLVVAGLCFFSPAAVAGASLRIAPVTLSLTAPAVATTLTLQNTGDRTINVQARIFQWQQTGGVDDLIATRDVAVSPPMARLDPGQQQTLRVVRIARTPLRGVETYRLLVDQLPTRQSTVGDHVSFVVRQSIPVFFASPDAGAARVAWKVVSRAGKVQLVASNVGQQGVKVASPVIESGRQSIVVSTGLLGYVLGGSTMSWTIASAPRLQAGAATLRYKTETGDVSVPLAVGIGG